MKRTGAQIIWECLCHESVTTIFGYPGGAVLPAYDALLDYPIRHVLVRHEQGAAHMADGYARSSGRVGATIATSGPGATNLVTGIATAMADASPLMCITGQVSRAVLGTDAFQETDIIGVTIPITKHNYLVTRVCDIMPTLKEAFHLARSGRPGPVLVDITKDAQQATTDWTWDPSPVTLRRARAVRAAELTEPMSDARDVDWSPKDHESCTSDAIADILRSTGNNTVVVTETHVGDSRAAVRGASATPPELIASRFGTLGFGLPAAIGVKLANPEADVWAIVTDAGFQKMQAELTTAAQESVKVNVVIVTLPIAGAHPDFVKIAEAHGAAGMRATPSTLHDAARRARCCAGAVVIDCRIERLFDAFCRRDID